MKYYQSEARAKINLSIDVLRKRPDGYHDVKMIMQSVRLHDDVAIEKRGTGIEISCQFPWVPNDRRNTAYKAAEIIMEKFGITDGVKIVINKNIPVAAGLAGGSSDAASVILGLNELFSLGMNEDQLEEIGKRVGADVPYCIRGGTVLAEGIGNILTNLNPLPCVNLVLIKPKINVSTPWVYKSLNLEKIKNRPDTETLIKAISEKSIDFISKNMINVLETVTIEKYPVIDEIKKKLIEAGALGSIMSGSGPTVFGIFESGAAARKAFNSLNEDRWDSFLTETC